MLAFSSYFDWQNPTRCLIRYWAEYGFEVLWIILSIPLHSKKIPPPALTFSTAIKTGPSARPSLIKTKWNTSILSHTHRCTQLCFWVTQISAHMTCWKVSRCHSGDFYVRRFLSDGLLLWLGFWQFGKFEVMGFNQGPCGWAHGVAWHDGSV